MGAARGRAGAGLAAAGAGLAALAAGAGAAGWEFVGPRTYVQQGDPTLMSSASAVQQVVSVEQPGGAPGWLAATVNGGVWRTLDNPAAASAGAGPAWEPVTDGQPVTCASISALHASPVTPGLALAGCGPSTSSEMGPGVSVLNSGHWGGVMYTTDGGSTWAMFDYFPANYYVTAIQHLEETTLLVSARSHLYDEGKGGVWLCSVVLQGCERSFDKPVFGLEQGPGGLVAAAVAMDASTAVVVSRNGGLDWEDWTDGLSWPDGHLPFYPTVKFAGDGHLILGALTVDPTNWYSVGSALFWRALEEKGDASSSSPWTPLRGPVASLEDDGMPKDRMALLVDPDDSSVLYVAGNGERVAWRGRWADDTWENLLEDVGKAGEPHVDCRNFAWDEVTGNLLLVSDGGIFVREQPKTKGGAWLSANGNLAAMEFLSANLDPASGVWVGGAQDNCVQVGSTDGEQALGVLFGDGTATAVDYAGDGHKARFFGSTQFLGDLSVIYLDAGNSPRAVSLGVEQFFKTENPFPYFYHPMTLNRAEPTRLVTWADGTYNSPQPPGFYEFTVPHDFMPGRVEKLEEPRLLGVWPPFRNPYADPRSQGVYEIVVGSGGDPESLVAINSTHVVYRSGDDPAGKLHANHFAVGHPPFHQYVDFAVPVLPGVGTGVVGPVSHSKTVSLAVSHSDKNVLAVGGWPAGSGDWPTNSNRTTEVVLVSFDSGLTWSDMTRNLLAAVAPSPRARVSDLALVQKPCGCHMLLASTVNGVLGTMIGGMKPPETSPSECVGAAGKDEAKVWFRVGGYSGEGALPLVLAAGLQYNPEHDILTLATMGRGIWSLANVTHVEPPAVGGAQHPAPSRQRTALRGDRKSEESSPPF